MTSFEIFELKEFLARRFEELGGQKGASAPPVVRPLPSRESFCGRDFGLIQGARAQLAPPIPALAQGPPLLVTTVDAEEAFDWSLPLSRYSGNVGSIRVQGQAHKIYDRYNI